MRRFYIATLGFVLAIASSFAAARLCVEGLRLVWPLAFFGQDSSLAAPPERKPLTHVVLITADTLRPDHMSAYGYARETTPNIARFFQRRLFRRARSSAPCTVPAVKQLLSGRLDAQGQTLAETLRGHGFRTAAIVSQQQFVADDWGYARGFDEWDTQRELDQHGMSARDAREVSDRALAFLARQQAGTQPYFLWLHYFDPHDPYNPPEHERAFARNPSTFADGDRRTAQHAAKTDEATWYLVDRIFTPEDRDNLTRLYDDEIRYLDEQLGRVLHAIAQKRPEDRVLVVFTADHGELLGERGVWDHCYALDDAELHVPLAVHGFGRLVDSALSRRPTSTLDVVPTLLRELGIPTKDLELDGAPVWAGHRRQAPAVFAEHATIATDTHKLLVSTRDGRCTPERLIALKDGLDEAAAELSLPANAPSVLQLSGALCEQRLKLQRAVELAEQDLARLKALGYTQ